MAFHMSKMLTPAQKTLFRRFLLQIKNVKISKNTKDKETMKKMNMKYLQERNMRSLINKKVREMNAVKALEKFECFRYTFKTDL
jgi:hypothetical protein